MSGFFITLEGIDGTGKSTQARLLAHKLTKEGFTCLLTREPGGTYLAERLRELLLTTKEERIVPAAEVLLYAAARAQHVAHVIRPALAEGQVVICERFSDSTLAYQGYGNGFDFEMILQADRLATGGLTPDLTVLFDLEVAQSWQRIGQRNGSGNYDRMEAQGIKFLNSVRHGYLKLAERCPQRVKVLSVQGKSPEEIHALVWRMVREKIIKGG